MRISFVEMAGFRGFRDRVRLEFPRGFVVISGRNGVGKSTVCDAIEFALTGGIAKYHVDKSGRESLSDYFWWRGSGAATEHYVSVGFIDGAGMETVVVRSRKEGLENAQADLDRLLCNVDVAPENAIEQLCRTSIIRDELIAQLSLDLSDTDRFELVSKALGAIQAPGHELKAAALVKAAETAKNTANARYQGAAERLSSALAELSRARDAASTVGDLLEATCLLSDFVPFDAGIPAAIRQARPQLAVLRRDLAALTIEVGAGLDAEDVLRTVDTPVRGAAMAAAETDLAAARERVAALETSVDNAELALKDEQAQDKMATALVSLLRHGHEIGLIDGACPLCNTAQSADMFAVGLAAAETRISLQGRLVDVRQEEYSKAREALHQASKDVREIQARLEELAFPLANARAVLDRVATSLAARLRSVGLGAETSTELAQIEHKIRTRYAELVALEGAMATLEASTAVERIAECERVEAVARAERDEAADRAIVSETAFETCKKIANEAKRASGEIINERLALISPLLNELYQRLRPHSGWRSIDYAVRGDVRRFLSLRVGDNLNPSFVFSSGQRRAAGLAFLLSVHLSRPWSRLDTLILDDPVQHIDDFRALQLVEVLAALRQDGRQIICAIEDSALADLLARRLRSNVETPGVVYELAHSMDGTAAVVSRRDVAPPPAGILRRGSALSLAS